MKPRVAHLKRNKGHTSVNIAYVRYSSLFFIGAEFQPQTSHTGYISHEKEIEKEREP